MSTSSPQVVPPASPPPENARDSGPDTTPIVITPSPEVVAETGPDESITSVPPAPRPQSPEHKPPRLVHTPPRVDLHAHHAPALLSVSGRPHSLLTINERDRPLPAVPANATLAPQREGLLRPRVASDPGYASGHAHPRSHRFRHAKPPPVQPLELPGAAIYRQRPALHPGEFEFPDGTPARIQSPFQNAYPLGSVGARLDPTLKEALRVRDSAAKRAKWSAHSINIAIALQVILGALTTALGASLRGDSIRISVAALGSLATLVASYLARTRGSSEPETSLLREQALDNFIRRLRSFVLDAGLQEGHDHVVENFRNELERLLNPSDPNAKKNRLLFDRNVEIDDEALDFDESREHDRARHHTHTETFKSCHCGDGRRPKGKTKVIDSRKQGENRKKYDTGRDGGGDEDGDMDDEYTDETRRAQY